MKKGSKHTDSTKARIRMATRFGMRRERAIELQREPWEPCYRRHYEPDLTPEVVQVQDRMLAQFGRGGGTMRAPIVQDFYPEKFHDYGMRICRGCGKLNATDFAGCTNCDNGKAVIIR